MLKWKDDYVVGVELIDEQHKKLFEIANRAYDLLQNDIYLDKYNRIVAIIEELKNYAVFHFKSEEDYMLSIGYKKYFAQKVEHDDFVAKINSMDLGKIDENQDKSIMEILEFVVEWISQHILEKDKLINEG